MKKIHRVFALLLAAAILAVSAGCQKEVTAEDLLAGVEAGNSSDSYLNDEFCKKYCSSAFKMLQSEYSPEGGNVILSPLTAFSDAGMLVTGSTDAINDIIRDLFDRSVGEDQIGVYMHSYGETMKDTDYAKMYFKNAIWFNSDKKAEPSVDFLTNMKTYYGAAAYRESFGKEAVGNINNWVYNNTNMMVDNLVDSLPSEAPAYLINATYLDADWEDPISPENVLNGTFHSNSGADESVQMMTTYEYIYIYNDDVSGFVKYYTGKNYAFVALLPRLSGTNSVANLLSSLSYGDYYRRLVSKQHERTVDASIPKFSCEYIGDMKPSFNAIRLGELFTPNGADLGKVGTCDGKMYIGGLRSYVGLSVTEKGTNKGTGATATNSAVGTAVTTVLLDRPFVFAVVDTKYYLPIMVGAVNTING